MCPSRRRCARRFQPREVVAGVVRGAGERRGRDEQEALGEADRGVSANSSGVTKRINRMMLRRRLQILADGEEIDPGRAHVVHHLQHFVALFAEAHHHPRLGEQRRVELLGALQGASAKRNSARPAGR